MTSRCKLQTSIELIKKLSKLIEGNEYETFFSQHLTAMKIELNRQLTNPQ